MPMLDTLLDPERRQKAQEDQVKLQALMGPRVMRQPAQAKYLYGLARERMALDQLAEKGSGVTAEDEPGLFLQLAEGLMLQGKFEAAAAAAPEGPHKQEFEAKLAAINSIDEQQCADPPTRQVPTDGISALAKREHADQVDAAQSRMEATQLPFEKVWNGKQTITFTRCLVCGAISAYA
jgi:hypothetical protein